MLRVAPVAEKAMWRSQFGVQPPTILLMGVLAVQTVHGRILARCDSSHLSFSCGELLSKGPWPDEVHKDQLTTRIILVTNCRDSFPYFVYSNKRQQIFCEII